MDKGLRGVTKMERKRAKIIIISIIHKMKKTYKKCNLKYQRYHETESHEKLISRICYDSVMTAMY